MPNSLILTKAQWSKGRRHYKLQELKVIAAMERRMRSGRAALATKTKTKTNSAARLRRLWN
jgi:hypothetical protein